jgi:hypothetical protein
VHDGERVDWYGRTHANDGVLALDSRDELLLLDLDNEVSRLEVAGHVESNVQLANRLRPLVGQGGLLLFLLDARCRVVGGGGFFVCHV